MRLAHGKPPLVLVLVLVVVLVIDPSTTSTTTSTSTRTSTRTNQVSQTPAAYFFVVGGGDFADAEGAGAAAGAALANGPSTRKALCPLNMPGRARNFGAPATCTRSG